MESAAQFVRQSRFIETYLQQGCSGAGQHNLTVSFPRLVCTVHLDPKANNLYTMCGYLETKAVGKIWTNFLPGSTCSIFLLQSFLQGQGFRQKPISCQEKYDQSKRKSNSTPRLDPGVIQNFSGKCLGHVSFPWPDPTTCQGRHSPHGLSSLTSDIFPC